MWQFPSDWQELNDPWHSAEDHRLRNAVNHENNLPKVRVKHVIMKYSHNSSAADVQRTSPDTTSEITSPASAPDDIGKDQCDFVNRKHSHHNAGAFVQSRNTEITSKTASNITTGEINIGELHRRGQQATSQNFKTTISSNSRSRGGDGIKTWSDSGNMTRWKRTSKLSEVDYEGRLVKSEGQTPVSTDDCCRVSRTSSLDQLRLRYQHQRKNAGRFREELDHLKKKVLDAQHELDWERCGRRKLEEWTEYLESELQTYVSSQSLVEKQYAVFYRVAQKTGPIGHPI